MKVLVGFCVLFGTISALAQSDTGRISGTITDSRNARVVGAQITIVNQATGIKWKASSDHAGLYVVANLPVGAYSVQVEAPGFKRVIRQGFDLVDEGRVTVDVSLEVGGVEQTVEVMAAGGEHINTVSGEISRVIDAEQVQNLALNGRNYMQLVSLIPGVALTSLDQMATTTSLSVSNQSINGYRTDSTNLMVDGGTNLDSGSNGSQNNNVGIDFIEQVHVQTSSFSAEYGRYSGAAVNVVTKSGGSKFHGSLFEYIRNDYVDAKDYFAPTKPELRFNDYGWSFGGPLEIPHAIKPGKLFFFAGQEWKAIRRFTSPSRQTMPTLAELTGNFSDRTTTTIDLPGTKTPIPNKNLASLMTVDGTAVMNVYAAMIKQAAAYSNTPTSNNATFQVFNPFNFREDIARLDYRPAEKHAIYFRYLHDAYSTIDPFGTFNASALPTTPTLRDRPAYGPQLGYTWAASPTLLNEARLSTSWNSQRTPLQGAAWQRATYGFQFPLTYGGNGTYSTGMPDVTVQNFASFNGPARVYLFSPTTDISFTDNVTWIRGAHTIKAGFLSVRNRKDQNGRTVYDGSVVYNTGSPNTNTTGYALADAALGQFQTYTEAGSDPVGFFRFSQQEAFVEDTWRAASRLSLTIGLRYSYFTPIYTIADNIANFVPSLYNPATAVSITNSGLIVPGSGNAFDGLIRAGNGVPADQLARVPGGASALALSIPAGAPVGLYNSANLWMPRFGFAWQPFHDGKTVIRGGFGSFHDRTQGNMIFSQTALPPYSFQVQYQNGNLAHPSGAATPQPAPLGTIHALDPNLDVPVVYNYNLGVQRELRGGFFLDVTYAGNQGRHLMRQVNINEPTFAALEANQALPSASRPVTNAIVPYKGYSTIDYQVSDANANYNALQAYLTRRRGNLVMTAGYTFSKALADASAYNDTGDPVENLDRKYGYGPTTFDRRHIFFSTFTYRMPFFLHAHGVTGLALGGWELSGIVRFQSGPYLTPVGSSSIPGTRRAEYLGGPVSLPSDQRNADHWFNTSAFAVAPAAAPGNAGVGIIEGPGWENWDLSLRKLFSIRERVTLRFEAETFNAFNHVNLDAPAVTVSTTSTFGTVASSEPARNLQFGLHVIF